MRGLVSTFEKLVFAYGAVLLAIMRIAAREVMFYLSSLPCDAVVIGRAIRAHWGIENRLHWVLDVTFREDASLIRKGHGPENFSLLRRMAVSLLNQETSTKRSLRQKTKRAAMSTDYMLDILTTAMNA